MAKKFNILPDITERNDFFRIKLSSGKKVTVRGFVMGYTYSSLIEGRIDERLNRRMYLPESYSSDKWGNVNMLHISPSLADFKTELKPTHYSVLLHSNNPVNLENDWSELIVTWLDDLPKSRMIEDIIKSGINNIDWNNNAEDFSF